MDKPLNIRRIAELAKCSPSTVSRVLSGRKTNIPISEETRQRVLEVCHKLDYQPSIHALRFFSRQAGVIGFLKASGEMTDDDNLSKSLFAVCRELLARGYRTLPLLGSAEFVETKEHLNLFKRNEIDGLIVWGAREEHTFLDELAEAGFPYLLLTNRVGAHPAVYAEQKEILRILTQSCIDRGARRIAGIMSRNGDSYRQRLAGFLEAAEPFSPQVCFGEALILSDVTALADAALNSNPDAVICANDEAALAVEMRCMERGIRIPEDLLLTGGDNIRLSEYCPVPITTFDQMAAQCASLCADMMVAHLKDCMPLETREIPTAPIWRASLPEENGK